MARVAFRRERRINGNRVISSMGRVPPYRTTELREAGLRSDLCGKRANHKHLNASSEFQEPARVVVSCTPAEEIGEGSQHTRMAGFSDQNACPAGPLDYKREAWNEWVKRPV